MCDGAAFAAQFEEWQPLSTAANAVRRNRGVASLPRGPGAYCLRVLRAPTVDLPAIEATYRESELFKALTALER